MTKLQNPANFLIGVKMTKTGREALQALAASEHLSVSEYARKTLNNRISYEQALGNPVFDSSTGEILKNNPNPSAPAATAAEEKTTLSTETKTNATRTAPPVDSSAQGA